MATSEERICAAGGLLIVIETSSREDYAATRGFYEELGYVRAARVKGYYAPDDDLIVYTKSLIPSPEK